METHFDKVQKLAELDLYEILEIDPSSTKDVIKESFRKLVIKYHPDKIKKKGKEVTQNDINKFDLIRTAFDILYNDETRTKYDSLHPIYKDAIKSFDDLRDSYKKYVKENMIETNENHLTQENIYETKLSDDDIKIKLEQLMKERDNISIPLPQNTNIDIIDFNKQFSETITKDNTQLIQVDINPVGDIGNYSGIDNFGLYDEKKPDNEFGKNFAHITDAFELPSQHIDLNTKIINNKEEIEQKMEEYLRETKKFDNMKTKDFNKDTFINGFSNNICKK